jgi:glycine betaine monooxygenase B
MKTISELSPDIASREVFACGPGPYLEAVREIVHELGVPDDQYHEETFTIIPRAEPTAVSRASVATATSHVIEFRRSQRSVEIDEDTTLLEAAAKAGVAIASACQQGICGTCKTTRISGEVEMSDQGGFDQRRSLLGRSSCAVQYLRVMS